MPINDAGAVVVADAVADDGADADADVDVATDDADDVVDVVEGRNVDGADATGTADDVDAKVVEEFYKPPYPPMTRSLVWSLELVHLRHLHTRISPRHPSNDHRKLGGGDDDAVAAAAAVVALYGETTNPAVGDPPRDQGRHHPPDPCRVEDVPLLRASSVLQLYRGLHVLLSVTETDFS